MRTTENNVQPSLYGKPTSPCNGDSCSSSAVPDRTPLQKKGISFSTNASGKIIFDEKYSDFLRHTVTPADTLVGIAMRYKVSVPSLKRINLLTSTEDIWFKKELIIPRKSLPDDFADNQSLTISASESHKISAIMKMADFDDDKIVRLHLRHVNGDFSKTLKNMILLKGIVAKNNLTAKEVLAYFNLHDNNGDVALEALINDIHWEETARPSSTSDTSGWLPFSTRRKYVQFYNDMELEMKKMQ